MAAEERDELMLTEGEMQLWLEYVQTTLHQLHRALYLNNALPLTLEEPLKERDRRRKPALLLWDAREALETVIASMQAQWGSTDGALCPHKDCQHHLAFTDIGWHTCGHCLQALYVERDVSTSAYVTRLSAPLAKPDAIRMARDCGPSNVTPADGD